jgi:putative ABC transport system permease protein
VLGLWGTDLIVAALPAGVPRPPSFGLDGRVLAFTTCVALGAAVVFGILPAFVQLGGAAELRLKEGRGTVGAGRAGRRTRHGLVVAELALAMMLLVGAGLMVRSFVELLRQDPGFTTDNVISFEVTLPEARYADSGQRLAFYDALAARLHALPGVVAVAASNDLPMAGSMSGDIMVQGQSPPAPGAMPYAEERIVSSEYFSAMGVRLQRGRLFTDGDRIGTPPVVIVSESMARRFWPGEDPIGRRIRAIACGPECWEEIVGVVNDVRVNGLDQEAPLEVYAPMRQIPLAGPVFVVRASSDPERLVPLARGALAEVDPQQPLFNVRTLEAIVSATVARRRLTVFLLGAFGALAVLMATVGVAGVTSYAVSQRVRELGIRMALGASPAAVFFMVIAEGLVMAGEGLGLGVLGALALTHVLRGELYGVSPLDATSFLSALALLALVTVAACYPPARRAAGLAPLEALRQE